MQWPFSDRIGAAVIRWCYRVFSLCEAFFCHFIQNEVRENILIEHKSNTTRRQSCFFRSLVHCHVYQVEMSSWTTIEEKTSHNWLAFKWVSQRQRGRWRRQQRQSKEMSIGIPWPNTDALRFKTYNLNFAFEREEKTSLKWITNKSMLNDRLIHSERNVFFWIVRCFGHHAFFLYNFQPYSNSPKFFFARLR